MSSTARILSLPSKPSTLESQVEGHHTATNGGDDGGNNMLEVRVAKLEADVENIKINLAEARSDIRELTKTASDTRVDVSVILQKLIDIDKDISKKSSSSEMSSAIAAASNKQIIWTISIAIAILGLARFMF